MNPEVAAVLRELQRLTNLELDSSVSAIARAQSDFGGLCMGSALGVIRPTNASELPGIVRFARRHGLKLTLRGKGLSQSGQAVANRSVLVDLSGCDAVGAPDTSKGTIVCESGATWRAVVAKTAACGLGPRVVPLNLDLSVGGTLAAGGFGSSSHRDGVAASHLASVEVALGSGEVVKCGPATRREIFDAVLGGVGRCGMIMRAEIDLVPVRKNVRTFFLLYESLDELLNDQQRVACDDRATHLEAFCSASIQGLRRGPRGRLPLVHWLFGQHLGVGYEADAPATETVLRDLRYSRLLHVEDDEYLGHSARYDSRFQLMRLTGAWDQLHPWFEALLPAAVAPQVIREALSLLPMFFGDGHRIFIMAKTDRPASLAFPSQERAIGFSVLPSGIPNVFRDQALESLAQLDDIVRQAGGKRYLSGWLFRTDPNGWETHYAGSYSALLRTIRECDPDSVFQSCLAGLGLGQSPDADIEGH